MVETSEIPCLICKKPFVTVKRNGLNITKVCPECRPLVREAKRKLKEQKKSLTPKERKTTALMELSHPALLKLAQQEFNTYIRNRDRLPGNKFYCPTCDTVKDIKNGNNHACHLYPAGHYTALRFNENNCFSGCSQCNYFKHGSNYRYNDWVRAKLGAEEYDKLLEIHYQWNREKREWDRYKLIEIITEYRIKNKQFNHAN